MLLHLYVTVSCVNFLSLVETSQCQMWIYIAHSRKNRQCTEHTSTVQIKTPQKPSDPACRVPDNADGQWYSNGISWSIRYRSPTVTSRFPAISHM